MPRCPPACKPLNSEVKISACRFGGKPIPAETRYRCAVDVKRAGDLYAHGWTLRQIGAELGVHWSTVSQQLQRAGITVRRGGPPAHPGSTQQIRELRHQGLTWNEVATKVDMTVSGAWSRYQRPGRHSPHGWGIGSGFFLTRLRRISRLASERLSLTISEEPQPVLSSPLHDEPHTVSPPSVVPKCVMCRAPMATTMQVIATTWCWRSRM
jgi:hypothetical protein